MRGERGHKTHDPNWLTLDDIELMRSLRAEGKTVEFISKALRVGNDTVSRYTMDLGPLPEGWKHRTVAQEWQIVGLSGTHSQAEIARIVGVGMWTVHNVQRKYHIVHRFGRHHVASRRYAFDEHRWGELLEELYVNQHKSMSEIARELGMTQQTIKRRLVKLGFRLRTLSQQQTGSKRGPYQKVDRSQ